MSKKPNCRDCGMCCLSDSYRDPVYVAVGPFSFKRLSTYYQTRKVWKDRSGFPYLKTKDITIAKGPLAGAKATVCVALQGNPMHRVRCTIYDCRPDVCKAFRAGQRECKSCMTAGEKWAARLPEGHHEQEL